MLSKLSLARCTSPHTQVLRKQFYLQKDNLWGETFVTLSKELCIWGVIDFNQIRYVSRMFPNDILNSYLTGPNDSLPHMVVTVLFGFHNKVNKSMYFPISFPSVRFFRNDIKHDVRGSIPAPCIWKNIYWKMTP